MKIDHRARFKTLRFGLPCIVVLLLALLLVACKPITRPTAEMTGEQGATEETVNTTPDPGTVNLGPTDREGGVQYAMADLAERLAIDVGEITVLEASDVTWRDSSLGCPQPDMMYAQVLTFGQLILLTANGQEYAYHQGENQEPFLCEQPTEPDGQSAAPPLPTATSQPTRSIIGIAPSEQAIEDLAARLQVAPTDITVVRMVEVDWPDASYGCPQPGMQYAQVLTNGSFIQLQVGDELYNYHSGVGRVPFLCTSPDEFVPAE